MKKLAVGFVMMSAMLLGAACSKDEKPEAKPAETAAAPAAAPAAESIGVPECDAYFKKVADCMGKKPELKPMLEPAMKQSAQAWKPLAANPATRDGLIKGCNAAVEQLEKQCN
ncbi:hypothetical protein [Polyangium spumosum]|uniref:Glutaconyl-CoA decarboxylase subunit gamma n=1 Tax=Polyangium spumosum TaxID=889282 RepID=A0A6N7PSK9_9BACT|nr:hypothetical protein [Polyangium spumosum]MRG93806.1 hypothetical protein [Polyangium spumosum]